MKIERLIFDLDNTLYPSTGAMDAGISRRMLECVQEFFGISEEEAIEKRRANIQNFSTTLEWLRSEGMNDTEHFFAHVHPQNEVEELTADLRLRPFLISLPFPKMILTNAPREHAERVLEQLGVTELFDSICDIRDCNFLGKPYKSAYEKALLQCGGTVQNTLFLDDMIKYTDGYQALGGTAVLIGNKNGKPLSDATKARMSGTVIPGGATYRLPDIYALPDLLKDLQEEK